MEIVKKLWGEEHWLANDEFCCKKLILKEDYRCSLHYHEKKDELFYILEGKVLFELNDTITILLPNNYIRVLPYATHRFTGLTDSVILESSTHHEEEDSIRIMQSGKVSEEINYEEN
jgi:mannose-6-phosphate isomerase-like protein (cupin superfamily)